uniref:Pescadillo-1 n=1 Tax=Schmidtea mediterranea TaxID=79327 RepID=I1ZIF5_SCHMD|nr:pescadillo-1 [Schmidtea mediterranea]
MTQFNGAHIMKCKRLKLEFMNYCITKQALRKCFVSVKGYYLEVEICGISVRWVAPLQHVAMSVPVSPDYRMLANQVEFDCVLLESLLLNLYTESGLIYPPKFAVDETNDWNENDILASMAFPLLKAQCDSETDADQLALSEFRDMDDELTAVVEKQEKISAIQSLFRDKKIFLNREIPREFFCFLLRCCGATEVSWDWAVATGATFGVDDNTIQYHVLDRPLELASTHINRFYVQPQFVIDSINAGRLLPVKDYLPGMKLIPHLSPFADYTKGYVPPEYRYLKGELDAEQLYADVDSEQDGDEEAVEEIDEEESELDDESDEEEEDCLYEEDEMEVEQQPVKATKKPARINRGKYKEQVEARKEIKLREIDLPRKRRNLYNKMKHAEKKEKSTVENLKQKRKAVNKKRMSLKK